LGCVIVDEAHYINDRDRGRIWEETIILLPPNIQLLLLSATLAKCEELCGFIENRGGEEVYVCSTPKRVVPLTHCGFLTIPQSQLKRLSAKDSETNKLCNDMFNRFILLKKPDGHFQEENYDKMRRAVSLLKIGNIRVNRFFVLNEIVSMLKTKDLLPAIVFVFSRRQVDIIASKIQVPLLDDSSKIPSIIEKECDSLLRSKFTNYKEYLVLPEYRFIIRLLKKGIAIHHAGILKEFREMTELLFEKGYVKLLLATETFAVGINMPTKTTIFTSLQKFDGNGFRFLLPHEYVQMAGRAGRRGIDTQGLVVHANNLFSRNEVPAKTYKHMLTGLPAAIESKFSIHTNLILHLISTGNHSFKDFIGQSMITNDISCSQQTISREIAKFEKDVRDAELHIRTPLDTLERLHAMKTTRANLKQKARKRRHREIATMEESTKFIVQDYDKFIARSKQLMKIRELHNELEHMNSYIDRKVESQMKILLDNNFIETVDADSKLTLKGRLAINLQEVFSLGMAEVLDANAFDCLDPDEIVSVISCFTNVRLSDDQSVFAIQSIQTNDKVKKVITSIRKTYDKYLDMLALLQMDIVENCAMQYNMCELARDWCQATDEFSCRSILREARLYEISLGDFVKAILKINNIAQELEKCAIIQENTGLLEKLKAIPELTLKSCVTNQSLYL